MHIIDSLPKEVDSVILAVSYMRDKLEEYFKENDVAVSYTHLTLPTNSRV